jgi:acetyl esterase/lipase
MPDALAQFVDAVRQRTAHGRLPDPPFEREPGEPTQRWRARMAEARAAHDAHAVAWRAAITATARELTGASVEDLLPPPVLVRESDTVVGGVPVHVTEPSGSLGTRPRPVILRLHGGAYWMGGGAARTVIDRPQVVSLAAELGAAVFDIDYGLAPERPYPQGLADTQTVLAAVRDRSTGHHIDPARVALLGTSSGGNLAALVALDDAGRRGSPPLRALALLCPSADMSDVPAEVRANPHAWSARAQLIHAYLGALDPADARVSPALRTAFDGVPPTFVATALYDEIARGGAELARRITESGGYAELYEYEMTHTVALPETEARVVRQLVGFLRPRLSETSV